MTIVNFSQVAQSISEEEAVSKAKNRLMRTFEKQEKVLEILDSNQMEGLKADLKNFIDLIPKRDIVKTRIFVTTSKSCDFHISALKIRANQFYTLILEEDKMKEGSLVIRVIVNEENQYVRINGFMESVGIPGFSKEIMKEILDRVDENAGIDVLQITWREFISKFGQNTNFFKINEEVYGIFDEANTLVLTSIKWVRQVYLKMNRGEKPWKYKYEKDQNGNRVRACFRLNIYGNLLWKS